MKSKSKALLTIEQVNENLKKQFPENQIICTEINENEIYIESDAMNIVVKENQIFKMATTESMMEYKKFIEGYHLAFVVKHFKYAVYIPFIYLRKLASNEVKEQESKVLIACGLKKNEQKQSPLARLKIIGGKSYVDFYKIIKEVEIIKATNSIYIDYMDRKGETLIIEHTKGKFSFPIDNVSENSDGELKRIFYEIINVPVVEEIKRFQPAIDLYSTSKMVS